MARTPANRRPRRLALAVALALVALLVLAGTAFASAVVPESGGSPNADDIATLYKLILAVAVVIFIGVEGALFYSLFKFRARKGAVPAQIRGNTRLEVGWTVGAALILVVLAVFTFAKLGAIRNPPNSGPAGLQLADGVLVAEGPAKRLPPNGKSLNICVNGQQYIWRYTYANDCANAPLNSPFSYQQMVVPVDTTVTLDINAQDVAHSWWIPKLGGKFDAIRGLTNETWFKASETGVFAGLKASAESIAIPLSIVVAAELFLPRFGYRGVFAMLALSIILALVLLLRFVRVPPAADRLLPTDPSLEAP